MKRRFLQLIGLGAVVVLAVGSPGAGGAGEALPLVGAEYSHYGVVGCDVSGQGILGYGMFDRTLIRRQLAAMRAAGLQSLRLFVWHMHDASNQTWGVVSSAGGRLGPVETKNLADFATDVRRAGFTRLTVVFGPEWTNDPIGYPTNNYDPSLFDENWQFIRYVRGVVKQTGPADTRFDLLNEGAPSDYLATKAQIETYLAQMYSNYVDAFGNGDVTVSSIVGANDQSRIGNLIDTLRSTSRPLPTWFEVHTYSQEILADLSATDATLSAKGLSQPITLGETYYNDPTAASAVKTFAATSARRLDEVIEWPLRRGSICNAFSVSPPYRADQFITALSGSPPSNRIALSVGSNRNLSLETPYGQHVTALEAGEYTFAVSDQSRTDDVHITGPRLNVATGLRFRGNEAWTLRLRHGTYRYRSDRTNSHFRGTFTVLTPG